MEFVSPEGLRLDGRRPKELRQLKAELGVLASADGSAEFQMGNTRVLAAVFGPKEPEQRSQQDPNQVTIRCEYAMAAFSTGARGRGAGAGREPGAAEGRSSSSRTSSGGQSWQLREGSSGSRPALSLSLCATAHPATLCLLQASAGSSASRTGEPRSCRW